MNSLVLLLLSVSVSSAPLTAADTVLLSDFSSPAPDDASNIFQGGAALQEHGDAAAQHHVQAVWGHEIPRTLVHNPVTFLTAAGLAVVFLLVLCFNILGHGARGTSRRLAEGDTPFDENCLVSLYNKASRRLCVYGIVV